MADKTDVWQGTLALMVLKTLETMGPQHGYGMARRIEQTSGNLLSLNYGTLYPALLKLEQEGSITSEWGTSENNRRAKFYRLTRVGRKQLEREARSWEQATAILARFLSPAEEGTIMRRLRALWIRLRGLFPTSHANDDISAELESHLQMHIDDNLHAGMTPEEARRQALIQLGGFEQTRQAVRERGTLPWVETLAQDLRFAVRQLRQGARLYRGRDRHSRARHWRQYGALLHRQHRAAASHRAAPSGRTRRCRCFEAQLRARLHFLSELPRLATAKPQLLQSRRIYRHIGFVMTGRGESERVRGNYVSSSFLPLLGVKPILGRLFAPKEDEIGRAPLIILGGGFWARKFGSDRNILGQSITLDGTSYTIIGVVPPLSISLLALSLRRTFTCPLGNGPRKR